MTTWKEKVKFPCGYEWEFEFRTWTAEPLNLPDAPKQCPIHGNKCLKIKSKKNKNEN